MDVPAAGRIDGKKNGKLIAAGWRVDVDLNETGANELMNWRPVQPVSPPQNPSIGLVGNWDLINRFD